MIKTLSLIYTLYKIITAHVVLSVCYVFASCG
jgi:hypothetical protein